MELALTDAPDPSARDVIAAGLGVLNTERAGPGEWRRLAVLIRDETGAVTGGLWGVTSYGWLSTELLFVPAALRGRGLGAEILGRAEAEARSRGCRGAGWTPSGSRRAGSTSGWATACSRSWTTTLPGSHATS